jgi:hypothetical protein
MAFYFSDFTSSYATPHDASVLGDRPDRESEAADLACDRFGPGYDAWHFQERAKKPNGQCARRQRKRLRINTRQPKFLEPHNGIIYRKYR